MAQKAVTWAMTRKNIDPISKWILVCMATLANQHGVTTARRDLIADLACVADTTVWRHFPVLEERGLIKPLARPSKDGPETRRYYRLMMGSAVTEEDEE